MSLPDFFVAGAPKAGTTALHAALAQHPELFMSPVKEPKFFLTDGPPLPPAAVQATYAPTASTCGAGMTTKRCSTRPRPAPCAASRPRSTSTTGPRSGVSARWSRTPGWS